MHNLVVVLSTPFSWWGSHSPACDCKNSLCSHSSTGRRACSWHWALEPLSSSCTYLYLFVDAVLMDSLSSHKSDWMKNPSCNCLRICFVGWRYGLCPRWLMALSFFSLVSKAPGSSYTCQSLLWFPGTSGPSTSHSVLKERKKKKIKKIIICVDILILKRLFREVSQGYVPEYAPRQTL